MQTSHMLVSSSSREGRNSKHEGERRPASNFLFGKEAFITSNLAPFLATSSRSPATKDGPGQLFLGPPDSYGQCVQPGILPSIIIFCQFLLFFTNFWPKYKAIFDFWSWSGYPKSGPGQVDLQNNNPPNHLLVEPQ